MQRLQFAFYNGLLTYSNEHKLISLDQRSFYFLKRLNIWPFKSSAKSYSKWRPLFCNFLFVICLTSKILKQALNEIRPIIYPSGHGLASQFLSFGTLYCSQEIISFGFHRKMFFYSFSSLPYLCAFAFCSNFQGFDNRTMGINFANINMKVRCHFRFQNSVFFSFRKWDLLFPDLIECFLKP